MSLDDALSSYGLICGSIAMDGEIHRCGTTKKPKGKNGWCIVYDSGEAAIFGNWETGDGYEYWRKDGKKEFRSADRQHIEKYHKEREQEKLDKAEEAATYIETRSKDGFSDYLKRKRIYPHGACFDGGALIIPLQDAAGKIWSYQRISADGSKYFMSGGQVSGCYYPIFPARNISRDELVIVCEGFATGAAIYQETGLPVIVAFNAGNIKKVCDSLVFRNLIIAADNDASCVGEKSAKESGYKYVMPRVEGWDYSDVFLNGKDLKSDFISLPEKENIYLTGASGLVGEIADWITLTAIRPQPQLSLAAALAFVALIKGHKIEGTTSLRTNLLLLSLAPTGAGKEHPQACINKLANLCGLSKNLLGEPVSGSGFLTGLLEANRVGLLVMDEMGRFIGNISNRNSGGYQREIIDYMIKSFSKASSVLHGRQYGDSKKNPRIDVEQPHFCCLGSTVKEKLQAACTSSEIIDGFLNRWIVFSTDKRPDRSKQAKKIAPPEALIEKIVTIIKDTAKYDNYGSPILSEVRFTPESWDIFEKFRDEMDSLVASSPYPLNMLYGRSSEHAEKLALVLCDDEFILCSDIEYAIGIVRRSNDYIVDFAHLISDNQFESDFIRVREKIKEAKEIKRSLITYKCQFVQGGAKRISEILQILLDERLISIREEGKKITYKWIG